MLIKKGLKESAWVTKQFGSFRIFTPNGRGVARCVFRNAPAPSSAEKVENAAEESFRKGWKQIMNGETIPLSQLWEGFDDD